MKESDSVRILYVDDEEINLLLFERTFGEKYMVETASSGPEGLNLLNESKGNVQVVISDMRMSEMNGVEFITAAKEKYPQISYFILTGFAFGEEIDQAIATKLIEQSFTKPYDVDQIDRAIQYALSR